MSTTCFRRTAKVQKRKGNSGQQMSKDKKFGYRHEEKTLCNYKAKDTNDAIDHLEICHQCQQFMSDLSVKAQTAGLKLKAPWVPLETLKSRKHLERLQKRHAKNERLQMINQEVGEFGEIIIKRMKLWRFLFWASVGLNVCLVVALVEKQGGWL